MTHAPLCALLLALLTTLFASADVARAAPARAGGDDPLKGLRAKHPRLLVSEEQFGRIREAMTHNVHLQQYHQSLKRAAEKMSAEAPVKRATTGRNMLLQSRAVLQRVATMGGLYRLTGDKALADRAVKEMLAAAAFEDWNPASFLDVAEMTNAMGIGYDWLFDAMSPADRATVKTAIVEKGLKPGLAVYESGKDWPLVTHNWNQVCNGGLTVGALAVADEEPQLARKVLTAARQSIQLAMKNYGPDGGWNEGPMYQNYATSYNVYFLAALETALGNDFGLMKAPGLAETGAFRVQSFGPSGQMFNFADSEPAGDKSPHMYWLARATGRQAYDAFERRLVNKQPTIFHLLWYNPQWTTPVVDAALAQLPPSMAFRGVDVAFLRSGWEPDATYVGFKGGDNKANHAHLDLGTFVIDAAGKRFACDLGGDNYSLPGYFGGGPQRWTYFRLTTEGHNTLLLDGTRQDLSAKAPLVAFSAGPGVPGPAAATPGRTTGSRTTGARTGTSARGGGGGGAPLTGPFVVADLSAGYASAGAGVMRGIALVGANKRDVLVQDDVEARKPVDVRWNLFTEATVEISPDGASAGLTRDGAVLRAKIVSPPGAKFETGSISTPAPQKQQPDVRNLFIRLPEKVRQARIVVVFSPAGEPGETPVRPLVEWVRQAPLAPAK